MGLDVKFLISRTFDADFGALISDGILILSNISLAFNFPIGVSYLAFNGLTSDGRSMLSNLSFALLLAIGRLYLDFLISFESGFFGTPLEIFL